MSSYLSGLIAEWVEAEKVLSDAKEKEKGLRETILKVAFDRNPDELREGVSNVPLSNGYKLKADFKVTRSLPSDNAKVSDVLDQIANLGNEGSFIAQRIVKWKAEISLTEYRKLDIQYRELIDTILTAKPGLPSLDLIEPK
jgi:uncharacterized protein YggL (DUF469 family)